MISRLEAWLVHLATLLVGGTGVIYGAMRYLLEPTDPFSVVNHPWQPATQHLHVLTAPLLVFTCGLIWHRHVRARLQMPGAPRRKSGITLAVSLAPMLVSGSLIQVTVDDAWRRAWVVVHLVTGAMWVVGYLLHQLGPRMTPSAPLLAVRPSGQSEPSAGTLTAPESAT